MENSIYLALSKQVALKANMDIISNNIANASTSGYRAQNLMFEEYMAKQRGDTIDRDAGDDIAFVYNRAQYESSQPGPVRVTGNTLDIALNGPGFFGVQSPDGEVQFSRNGRLQMDALGTLVTSAGLPVADAGGAPIVIPEGSTEIKIDKNGFVSNQDGQLAQIQVVEFDNTQNLEPQGNGLYRAAPQDPGAPAQDTTVNQGTLEGSNVQTVLEITRMIETLRDFQATQNVLTTENERLRGMIQRLTEQS